MQKRFEADEAFFGIGLKHWLYCFVELAIVCVSIPSSLDHVADLLAENQPEADSLLGYVFNFGAGSGRRYPNHRSGAFSKCAYFGAQPLHCGDDHHVAGEIEHPFNHGVVGLD